MEKFNIESLYDKEIKVTRIFCGGGIYKLSGIIEDKYYIEASNGGEHHMDLEYDIDKKFTLESFNYLGLEVYLKDDDGQIKLIYYKPSW